MPVLSLGRRSIAQLAEVVSPTLYFDSDLKGFGLLASPKSKRNPDGAKTWFVQYRTGDGGRRAATKRVTMGPLSLLTPEKARQRAQILLAEARLGADHAALRKEARVAPTVAELATLYSAETDTTRKARTVVLYQGYWRIHVLPGIGALRARDVTRAQIARLHSAVGAKQRTTANRLLTLLSNFYSWAGGSGHVPAGFNPTAGVEKYQESGRERYLSQDEFARLGAAIREAETIGIAWDEPGKPRSKHNRDRRTVIAPEAAAALRLLLFTGARLREILHLQWENVDFDRGMLFLPDSKTGRKPVVLGAPALAVLAELRDARLARPTLKVSRRAALAGRSTRLSM